MQAGYARDNRVRFKERDVTGMPKGKAYKVKIDTKTLDDVARLCARDFPNGIKLKNTHDGDATDYLGKVTNVRREGNDLRGDVELNPEHPKIGGFRWALQNMSDNFGISVGSNSKYDFDDKTNSALMRPFTLLHMAVEDECAATDSFFGADIDGITTSFDAAIEYFSKQPVDKTNNNNMSASPPATAADIQPFEARCAKMEADIADMKSNFGKIGDITANLAKLTKSVDDLSKIQNVSNKAPDAPDGLGAVLTAIDNLKATIPSEEKMKLLVSGEIAALAGKMGVKVTDLSVKAGNDNLKKDVSKKGEKTFEQLRAEAVESKKYPNAAAAELELFRQYPAEFRDYSSRMSSNAAPDDEDARVTA